MRLIIRTVTIEAPGPFTDAEAEALVERLDLALDIALEAAANGVIDGARTGPDRIPLADSARAAVTD